MITSPSRSRLKSCLPLRALARRPKPALDVQLRFADLELVPAERVARRGDRVLSLTHREYALLEHLLRNPRRVQNRSRILEHVWDDNFDPVGNVVEGLIARLRRKVDAPGFAPLIHTVAARLRPDGYPNSRCFVAGSGFSWLAGLRWPSSWASRCSTSASSPPFAGLPTAS